MLTAGGGKVFTSLTSQTPSSALLTLFRFVKNPAFLSQLHAQIIVNGLHCSVLFGSKITNAYIELGSLHFASKAFYQIARKNFYSWNTIISGYSRQKVWTLVLELYKQMRRDTGSADNFNLVFAIRACLSLSLFLNGKLLHCLAVKLGFEKHPFVAPALIELYNELGGLEDAQKVFDGTPEKNKVVCGAMMKGYLKFSENFKVFEVLSHMEGSGVELSPFTLESLIRACGNVFAGREGKACHAYCIKYNFVDGSMCLLTSVVGMYMKCGFCDLAVKLFEKIPEKDVVLWTAMISGFSKSGKVFKAMDFFKQMLEGPVIPNSVTLASMLLACSQTGFLLVGKSVHGYMLRNGVELDLVNYTSFIDMYAKCGCIVAAKEIFEQMPHKNVFSWTAMINGFGMLGLYSEAISLFNQMLSGNELPNSVTFVSVLSACSHSGKVEEGWKIFKSMIEDYGIAPGEEHYACMIDLLCRSGRIDESLSFINCMPVDPGVGGWGALLHACRIHKKPELAGVVAKRLLPLEYDRSSVYVLLSQIYADNGMWDMMRKTRSGINEDGLRKSACFSSIEVDKSLYLFGSKDVFSHRNTQVRSVWRCLIESIRELGHVPDCGFVVHDCMLT